MTHEQHIQRHKELHKALDELSADYMNQTGKLMSQSSVMDLVEWSHQQTINPTTKHIGPVTLLEKDRGNNG